MKKQKGITLVALIITVIIMLILVAVSVNVIVKSNLISTAEKTANGYKNSKEQEETLGSKPITINGKDYGSLDEYLAAIEGEAVDNVKWIYVENEDGDLEITGIDLRGKQSEGETIINEISSQAYGTITLTLPNDTLVVPGTINGKNVVKVSLTENIYDGMLEADENWLAVLGVKNLIFDDNIEEIGGWKVSFVNVVNLHLPSELKNLNKWELDYFANLEILVVPDGCDTAPSMSHSLKLKEVWLGNLNESTFGTYNRLVENLKVYVPDGVVNLPKMWLNVHGSECELELVLPESIESISELDLTTYSGRRTNYFFP